MRFHKLHGAGNDFVVLDGRDVAPRDWGELAIRLCDRHRGVGADGLLVLENSAANDYRMRYQNADGSDGEMCGNGIRCMAKFVLDTGVTDRRELTWETLGGPIKTAVLDYGGAVATVRADMGQPRFKPADIPVRAEGAEVREQPFAVNGGSIPLTCVSMGNPHAVTFVDNLADYPLARMGPEVEHHPAFPERTNFEIVEVAGPDHLRMRVWERGVGETMACGTGACAAAVASQMVHQTTPEVMVDVPGGRLKVEWEPGRPVLMTGPAETAFIGSFED
jgi:diaminopimelate epimerase